MSGDLVWLGLAVLGALVGAFGTLVGAGGGFLLTPVLILLYPQRAPEVITAMSLGVVLANAMSGSVAYAYQRRIDYVAAGIFALAALPGAVIGASATGLFPRTAFEGAFGAFLLVIAVWLAFPRPARIITAPPARRFLRRLLTDSQQNTFSYSFDPVLAVALGLCTGFVSSLFGVGGGLIFTPAMVLLMRFPAYIATATSTFTLIFASIAGVGVHLSAGHFAGVTGDEAALAVGVLIGAQAGALLSTRMADRQVLIMRLLSLALGLVGIRLVTGVIVS